MKQMHKAPFKVHSVHVALNKMWEAEIPVGDPFGGAAYGEKNKKAFKSVVKVLAPIAAIAATVATGGAFLAAGGFAALSAGSFTALTTGLSFAGSALSVVGQATGNEKLTKIGGIASLAGGVGLAAYNIGQTGSVAAGLDKTFDQFSEGTSKAWEKLTGTPAGAAQGAGNTLSQTPTAASDFASGTGLTPSAAAGSVTPGAAGASGVNTAGLESALGQTTAQPGLISKALDTAKNFGSYVADPANAQNVLALGNIASSTAPYLFPSEKEEAEQKYLEELANRRQYELDDLARFNSSVGGLNVGFSGEATQGISQGFQPGQRYYQGDYKPPLQRGIIRNAIAARNNATEMRNTNPYQEQQRMAQGGTGLVRRALRPV